jgi:hypothetical protein
MFEIVDLVCHLIGEGLDRVLYDPTLALTSLALLALSGHDK